MAFSVDRAFVLNHDSEVEKSVLAAVGEDGFYALQEPTGPIKAQEAWLRASGKMAWCLYLMHPFSIDRLSYFTPLVHCPTHCPLPADAPLRCCCRRPVLDAIIASHQESVDAAAYTGHVPKPEECDQDGACECRESYTAALFGGFVSTCAPGRLRHNYIRAEANRMHSYRK